MSICCVVFLAKLPEGKRTRVKGGIDHLLRAPQLRSHMRKMVLLVRGDQLLSLLQDGRGHEHHPREIGISERPHTHFTSSAFAHLPRVGEVSRMPHATPVGFQIILRPREVPAAGEGGGHLQRRTRVAKTGWTETLQGKEEDRRSHRRHGENH